MRVLAVTKIFPNRLEPLSSPFNRQQFSALKDHVELKVLEAIPYVPLAGKTGFPARASRLASLPKRDSIAGIETHYMRQMYIPRFLPANLGLYAASLAPYLRLARWADVILGTWAYPDGCAAVLLGALARRPVVVKVHGSDINLVAKMPSARPLMKGILPRADAMVSVSTALSTELEGLGVSSSKIHLVPNGVDQSIFFVRSRADARRAKGLSEKKWILFCGRLEAPKGTSELLTAFDSLAEAREDVGLILLGDGSLRGAAEKLAAKYPGRVHVKGAVPLEEVASFHGASDVFCLPSYNEGTPNVVLEALASGRPVVATRVGGIPDVVREGVNGFLVPPKDAGLLRAVLSRAVDISWDEDAVAKTGPISWSASAALLQRVLEEACSGR